MLFITTTSNSDFLKFFYAKKAYLDESVFFYCDTDKEVANQITLNSNIRFRKLVNIWKLARHHKGRSICFENADYAFLLLGVIARIYSSSVIYTIHDQIPHPGKKYLFVYLYNVLACILANRVIIFSTPRGIFKNIPKKLVKLKLGGYEFTSGASSKKKFEYDKTLSNYDYIIFFGRGEPYKGIEKLPIIMERLQERMGSQCPKLIIVGRGVQNFLDDEARFTVISEYVDDATLEKLVSRARCTVMPYTSSTQSGVLLQSLAWGTPCVASDLPGFREYKNDFTFLCDQNNFDDFASYIEFCCEQNSLLKLKAKRFYAATYSAKIYAEQYRLL